MRLLDSERSSYFCLPCLYLQHARLEWLAFIAAGRDRQSRKKCAARFLGLDDRIHPQAGRGVTDVGLLLITRLDPVAERREFVRVRLLAGAPSQYALIAAPSWKLAPSLPRKLTVPSGSLTCNATCVPAVAPRL